MFQLMTERLFIRHFSVEDEEPLHFVFQDPEVMRYGDGVQSSEWIRGWLRNTILYYGERGFGPYAVLERHSNTVLGYCGLFYFPDVNGKPEVEIGYRLRQSAWGKGYATEAALAVRDYAFNILDMKRLIAIIDPSNMASIRVAKKLGMQYEQDVMFEGYSHPDHVYVATRA